MVSSESGNSHARSAGVREDRLESRYPLHGVRKERPMAGFRSRRKSLILRSGATTHPSARNPQHSRFFGVGFGRRMAETRSPCRHTCGRSIKCEAMDGRCRYLFIIDGGEEEGDEGRVGVLGLRRRWSWQVNRSWKRRVSHG